MSAETITIHPLRLLPGQDLRREIESFVQEKKIEAGYIISCCGSLSQYHIRFANQKSGSRLGGHYEVLSLSGTISIYGCHLHICIADEQGRAWGGHLLQENIIYTTAEMIIGESSLHRFVRKPDGTSPWSELQVLPRT